MQEKKRKTLLFLKRLEEQGQKVLMDQRDEETLKGDTGIEDIDRLTRERILSKKKPRPREILRDSRAFRPRPTGEHAEPTSYANTQELELKLKEAR